MQYNSPPEKQVKNCCLLIVITIRVAVATLIVFCNEISPGDSPPKDVDYLEELSKEELNELLATFYPNARKKNGKNYKKSAHMGLRFGLQRGC